MADRSLFDRTAIVTVDTIEIRALDFDFEITKTLKPEPNTCSLTIYNLNEEHQAQLEELRPKGKDAKSGIPCKLEAGYGETPSLLWLGDLRTVQTFREGTDWVTRLASGDGEKAWRHARISQSFGPKTPIDTALRAIARTLGVGEGNLSKVVARLKQAGSATYPSGLVLHGAASRHLTELARSAGLEVSIQDGALQFLDRGKALAGSAIVLSAATGLLDSPSVDNEGVVSARTLLIPDLAPGRIVQMEAERIKGAYRVEKCSWKGTTSGDEWYIDFEARRH